MTDSAVPGRRDHPEPNPRQGPMHDGLVVYGTGWCPDVRRSRAVLERADVLYRYVDLEQDPEATRLVRGLQRGKRRIPTLVWSDGDHLVEPTDDQLRARLTAQGGLAPSGSASNDTSSGTTGPGNGTGADRVTG